MLSVVGMGRSSVPRRVHDDRDGCQHDRQNTCLRMRCDKYLYRRGFNISDYNLISSAGRAWMAMAS